MPSFRVTLAERPTAVLRFLSEHGPATASAVSEATRGVRAHSSGLVLLVELGLVSVDTSATPTLWALTDEGERLVADAARRERVRPLNDETPQGGRSDLHNSESGSPTGGHL